MERFVVVERGNKWKYGRNKVEIVFEDFGYWLILDIGIFSGGEIVGGGERK